MPVKKIQNKTESQDTVKSTLLKNSKFNLIYLKINIFLPFLLEKDNSPTAFKAVTSLRPFPKVFHK